MGSDLSDMESLLASTQQRFIFSMLMVEVYSLTSPPVPGVMENQMLRSQVYYFYSVFPVGWLLVYKHC